MFRYSYSFYLFTYLAFSCLNSSKSQKQAFEKSVSLSFGAERTALYLPLLFNKKVALVANHTSTIKGVHLVDTLPQMGVDLAVVFSPEHGFLGNKGAGEKVSNTNEVHTQLPIISLYGKNYKPKKSDIEKIDVFIFDLQDVGVRFYTYISTLYYVMQACAEQNKPLIVLDRPNPNRHIVDGPMLDFRFRSFMGIVPVPVLYGMTIGELAKMINGEDWLGDKLQCDLTVIPLKNYSKESNYTLKNPSPNLPNATAIALYPSLCFFEPTSVSIGRGTPYPFQVIGYPNEAFGKFAFTPVPMPNAAPNPKWKGKTCYGINLQDIERNEIQNLDLSYLLSTYQKIKDIKVKFFTDRKMFHLLAGSDQMLKMIENGKSEEEIRQTWQSDLRKFNSKRIQYLLYPDFKKRD